MRMKPWLLALAVGMLIAGVLMMAGCSGGSTPTAEDTDATISDSTPSVETETPSGDEASVPAAEPSDDANATPATESVQNGDADGAPATEPAQTDTSAQETEQAPLLTWARDAGGLGHCDRMSVDADGSVVAIVCRGNAQDPPISATLSPEQLAQLTSWSTDYASFTRREMEMSNAVRTTQLNGTGSSAPDLETKKEIAAFAANLYFGITGTQ
jgi:hypothetical protein